MSELKFHNKKIYHKTKTNRNKLGKTQVQFFRSNTLGFLIEFKHMVALINETQIMLSFPRIFKFNIFEFKQEPNVFDLRNYT